jgi:hypothetical protein
VNVVELPTAEYKQTALEVIDSLKEAVEEGRVVAFTCVGISDDDSTFMYQASVKRFTKLRMMGAVSRLEKAVWEDEY